MGEYVNIGEWKKVVTIILFIQNSKKKHGEKYRNCS